MSLSGYLSEHWSMLVPLIGMSILLITEIHLERKMILRIAVITGLLFIYSVFCYIHQYFHLFAQALRLRRRNLQAF